MTVSLVDIDKYEGVLDDHSSLGGGGTRAGHEDNRDLRPTDPKT